MKENNLSNKDLMKAVNGLAKNVDKISTTTNGLTKDVKKIATSIDDLAGITKSGFEEVNTRITALEEGHEELKLRLSNVAYRFEIVELENQVKFLSKELKTFKQMITSKLKSKGNEA